MNIWIKNPALIKTGLQIRTNTRNNKDHSLSGLFNILELQTIN